MLDLYTCKRTLHGVELWWICTKTQQPGKRAVYTPYADIYAPTGYGFKSRAKADRVARGLEEKSTHA